MVIYTPELAAAINTALRANLYGNIADTWNGSDWRVENETQREAFQNIAAPIIAQFGQQQTWASQQAGPTIRPPIEETAPTFYPNIPGAEPQSLMQIREAGGIFPESPQVQGSGTLITALGTTVPGGYYGQFAVLPPKTEISGGVTFHIPERVQPRVPTIGRWWSGETGISGLEVGEAIKRLSEGKPTIPPGLLLFTGETYDPYVGARLQSRLGLQDEQFIVQHDPATGKYYFTVSGISITQEAINSAYQEERTAFLKERKEAAETYLEKTKTPEEYSKEFLFGAGKGAAIGYGITKASILAGAPALIPAAGTVMMAPLGWEFGKTIGAKLKADIAKDTIESRKVTAKFKQEIAEFLGHPETAGETLGFVIGAGVALKPAKSPETLKAEKEWKEWNLRETQAHELWKAKQPKVAYIAATDTFEFRPSISELQDMGIRIKKPSEAKVREYVDVRAALGKLKAEAPTREQAQIITTYGEPVSPALPKFVAPTIELNVPKGKIPEYLQLPRPPEIPKIQSEWEMQFAQAEGRKIKILKATDLFEISKIKPKVPTYDWLEVPELPSTAVSVKTKTPVQINELLKLDVVTEQAAQVRKIEIPGVKKIKQVATKTETTVTADVTGFMDPLEIGSLKQVKALNKLTGAKITQTPSEAWKEVKGGKLEVELFRKIAGTGKTEVKKAAYWTQDSDMDILGPSRPTTFPAEKKKPKPGPFFKVFEEPRLHPIVETGEGRTQQLQILKDVEVKQQQRQNKIELDVQNQLKALEKNQAKQLEELRELPSEDLGLKQIPKAGKVRVEFEKTPEIFKMPAFPIVELRQRPKQAIMPKDIDRQLEVLWSGTSQAPTPSPDQQKAQTTAFDFDAPMPPVQTQPTKSVQDWGWDGPLPPEPIPPRPKEIKTPRPPIPPTVDFGGDDWLPPALPKLSKAEREFLAGKPKKIKQGKSIESKYKPSFGAVALGITAKEKDIAKAFTGIEIRPIPVFGLPKTQKKTKAEVRHKTKADKFLKSIGV